MGVAVTSNFASEGNLYSVFFNELLKKKKKSLWKRIYYGVLNKDQRKDLREFAENRYRGTQTRIGKWLCKISPSEKNCESSDEKSSALQQKKPKTCKINSKQRMFYNLVAEMTLR